MMRGGRGAVSALAASMLLTISVTAQVKAQGSGTPVPVDAQPAAHAEPTLAMQAAARATEIGGRAAHADDIAALRDYYAANPDKPLWIEAGGLSARARSVIAELHRADDWGLTAASFVVPSGAGPDAGPLADAEAQLSLAVLKYARHARGGRMDPTQLTDAIDRTANLLAPGRVLAAIAAASATDEYLRKLHPQHPQFERLRKLYVDIRAGKVEQPAPVVVAELLDEVTRKGKKRIAAAPKPPVPLTAERVLFNMEQWRWMPDDLGPLHIAVNIPEFQIRVMKDGKPIHTERVVTGSVTNQTPIFSKDMETVVFQPGWGVPPSIKVKELLPGLLAGRDPVGSRGYRMSYRGREVSAGSLDWRSVDIRKVSIVQPPGPSNALGVVKFLFPNKHDVYLHDTPSKSLFNADMRAFSHGCVRVRNPVRLAEIIFAETGGWAPSRVASLVRGGKDDNQIPLPAKMGVHITYFTVVVDDDGKVHDYRDIYGHESRVKGGLEGRTSQVARKVEDLNAVRTALVGRSPSRRGGNPFFGDDDDYRSRGRNGSRSARSVRAARSGGGSSFSWFGN